MTKSSRVSLLVVSASVSAAGFSQDVKSISDISRLDLLPSYRIGKIGAITSYDRTEGNDDGFSGKYSFIRNEGDGLVIADLQGPGCITRLHTPTATDQPLEFYIDGEETPRIKLAFNDLFSGLKFPFVRPLVDSAGGGNYTYIPIPYAKSCKVVLRAPRLQFYDINYVTYPAGTKIDSYQADSIDKAGLERAKAMFSGGRDADLSVYSSPNGSKISKKSFELNLASGKTITLFDSKKGGRITGLRIGPSSAFVGKLRDIWIKATWDGARSPAIFMPAGDFFGYAWGTPAMGSALAGTSNGVNYCNFPMPFAKSAKIELVSLRATGAPLSIKGEVSISDAPKTANEGHFYAVWRRENPTTEGKPFTWLDFKGKGHVVGLSVQSQGIESGNTYFFEGDDITTIDGEMAVHGTGSEDFFNGGWYDVPGRWDGMFARAMSGCMAYQRYLGRTGAYRFMLGDAYSFKTSILQTIEHAPTKNEHPADYTGVAYLYADRNPNEGVQVAPESLRKVSDPSRIIYSAHWTMPIEGFSLNGSTLTRGNRQVGTDQPRILSLRAAGEGDFDLCFVTLRADIPSAGKYKVFIDAVKGPNNGIVQIFREDVPLGPAVDLYSATDQYASGIYVGEINAQEGGFPIMFKVIGKNPSAKALGLDLVNVICERQP